MNRDSKGKFTKKSYVGLFLGVLLVVYLVFGHPALMEWLDQELSYKAEATEAQVIRIDNSVEMFKAKIDTLKDEVIADLQKCESGGRKEEDGIVVLDSNDKGSYGVVQWQRSSVMHYYKLRTGEVINGRDAIILALTAEKAKDLAKWVIFETKNGVSKDWVNCSKWHGLQERVDMIKKLEK